MAVETDQNDNILRKQVRLITSALDKRIESQGAKLDQIAPLSGTSDPTTSTVGAIKQMYINLSTGAVFVCHAVAEGVYTWKGVGGAASGSLALIGTITLAEAVNAVTLADIGNNIYDELIIEYVGTASIANPTLSLRNSANTALISIATGSMTATRYIQVRIARLVAGASRLVVTMGHGVLASVAASYSAIPQEASPEGLAGFSLSLDGANTFSVGGVFRTWGRKWAI